MFLCDDMLPYLGRAGAVLVLVYAGAVEKLPGCWLVLVLAGRSLVTGPWQARQPGSSPVRAHCQGGSRLALGYLRFIASTNQSPAAATSPPTRGEKLCCLCCDGDGGGGAHTYTRPSCGDPAPQHTGCTWAPSLQHNIPYIQYNI